MCVDFASVWWQRLSCQQNGTTEGAEMKAYDIVGYTFNADQYCPACITEMLPVGEGEAYDGWRLASGVRMTTEGNLDEIAYAFGIDRMDESSYDSSEFPKVIFASQIEDDEYCGRCHNLLVGG
jgi:hypothetical protein